MAAPRHGRVATVARVLLALGVALALADASVVTLALPRVLTQLHTTIDGVAAVIGVYTVVLAGALPLAAAVRRRVGVVTLGVGGMLLFAAAGVVCGTASTLGVLLVARAFQGLGAAAGLVAAYALLHRPEGRRRDRLWVAGAIFGTAIGPVLGGVLTDLFDWRAIFLAQAPLGVLAAGAALGPLGERARDADVRRGDALAAAAGPSPPGIGGPERFPAAVERSAPPDRAAARRTGVRPPSAQGISAGSRRDRLRAGAALALVSAALTAVVFLLVLLLVSGWAVSPLKAALAVSILPLAAIAGSRIPGDPWTRACAGCGLVGGGVLALVSLPTVSPGWVVVPQLLAGVGMGLALPVLAGELLPERTAREAARLLSLRHVGITMALVVLAPLTAAELHRTVDHARLEGIALVLDARLPPQAKLGDLAPVLDRVDLDDARGSLRAALRAQAPRFRNDPEQAAAFATLSRRTDETVVAAVGRAFRPAFLVTGLLALLATLMVVPRTARRAVLALSVGALAVLVAGGQVAVGRHAAPVAVAIADPCAPRRLPDSGGLGGVAQKVALTGLDRAACRFGSSREQLVLALTDEDDARTYARAHGVDPRSLRELLGGAVAGGDGGFGRDLGDLIGGRR